jgi:saccharopine dehydrogenase-like NADP-dependent oxidoreductase
VSFNEVGVDPGLDHASAMKIIDEVHAKGGKVKSFLSYCGGFVAKIYTLYHVSASFCGVFC